MSRLVYTRGAKRSGGGKLSEKTKPGALPFFSTEEIFVNRKDPKYLEARSRIIRVDRHFALKRLVEARKFIAGVKARKAGA